MSSILFRSALLPPQQAALSSPFSKAGSQTTPASPSTLTSPAPSILSESKSSLTAPPPSGKTNPASEGAGSADAEKLRTFYQTALKDLEVLRRAALTNRMYTGEKLVIGRTSTSPTFFGVLMPVNSLYVILSFLLMSKNLRSFM